MFPGPHGPAPRKKVRKGIATRILVPILRGMESITRKDLGIKPHMNFVLFVVAVNPIKFSYMTAEDRIYNTGETVPHIGPKYFFKRETAEAARDRIESIGLLRDGVNGRYIAAKPEDFVAVVCTVEQYLARLEKKAQKL